jgi:hypothetical protein
MLNSLQGKGCQSNETETTAATAIKQIFYPEGVGLMAV